MYIGLLVNEIPKVISNSPENGISLSNTRRAMALHHFPHSQVIFVFTSHLYLRCH